MLASRVNHAGTVFIEVAFKLIIFDLILRLTIEVKLDGLETRLRLLILCGSLPSFTCQSTIVSSLSLLLILEVRVDLLIGLLDLLSQDLFDLL